MVFASSVPLRVRRFGVFISRPVVIAYEAFFVFHSFLLRLPMTWKVIFIVLTSVFLYFSYGMAAHGGMQSFFVGLIIGSIATWLFTRAKAEAQSHTNTNTQNVSVNLNQHKVALSGSGKFTEDDLVAIAHIVDTVVQNKLQVSQQAMPLDAYQIANGRELPGQPMTTSEQIAAAMRKIKGQ